MKKFLSFLIIVSFIGLTLFGCEKKDVNPNTTIKNGMSIRHFENVLELKSEMDNIADMDFDELLEYEGELSFNSYGKTAYILLEELTNDTTLLSAEMLEQIEQYYSQYFVILEEDTDFLVDVRYDNTPFSFIMNENRMFIVGDSVYKVFDNCLVITDIANIEDLTSLDEDGLPEIEGSEDYIVLYYQEDAKTNYGKSIDKECVIGKEKVKTFLVLTEIYRFSYNGNTISHFCLSFKIKGFRKFCGIFWPVKRILSNNINCGISINNISYYNSKQGFSYGYKREVYPIWITNVVTPQYYLPQYYIRYAVGDGRTPAAIAEYDFQ
ncbi:MAG: hypothetical protein J5730_01775 [Bacteroidales bacterium]|nr:hypothetical protein [Bacteroidales bacterium]